jgi:hypothetical protein
MKASKFLVSTVLAVFSTIGVASAQTSPPSAPEPGGAAKPPAAPADPSAQQAPRATPSMKGEAAPKSESGTTARTPSDTSASGTVKSDTRSGMGTSRSDTSASGTAGSDNRAFGERPAKADRN